MEEARLHTELVYVGILVLAAFSITRHVDASSACPQATASTAHVSAAEEPGLWRMPRTRLTKGHRSAVLCVFTLPKAFLPPPPPRLK